MQKIIWGSKYRIDGAQKEEMRMDESHDMLVIGFDKTTLRGIRRSREMLDEF